MLQLNEIQELIVGDATDYKGGVDDERHIFIFNAHDEENIDTNITAVIFADSPDEISLFSKNERDTLKISIDIREGLYTFLNTDGKIIGYFDENELEILDEKKEKILEFKEMAFMDNDEVPVAIVTDDIENEVTEKYFSLPHMVIEYVEVEEDNVLRNLILATLITLIL